MDVEVLLSTMNQTNENQIQELVNKMNIKGKVTVINQITDKNIKETKRELGDLRIYSYNEKGLSKSRNVAIEKLEEDIGIIADDDVTYVDNYKEIIKSAYEKYSDADIIAFNIESRNPKRPIKKHKTHKVKFISAMQIRSVQITLKKGINISFDENFGIGSKHNLGEENIWLYDCLKKRKNIYYVDELIGSVLQQSSTWYSKKDAEYMNWEGAVLYRISKKLYIPLIIQYAIRKRKEYKDNITLMQAIKFLIQGAKEYKNNQ